MNLQKWSQGYSPLFWGLGLSVVLTFLAYFLVTGQIGSFLPLTIGVLVLGGLQVLVQVFCFLHVGIETKPHWNLIMFLFMVLVVVVIVGGSIWIMQNLDYNVMPNM